MSQSGAPVESPSPKKRRKVPKLVWILLLWCLGTWGLWLYVTRPEVPPLDADLLAQAHVIRIDLKADDWGRNYLARLEKGAEKYTVPEHKDAHKVLFILEASKAGRSDAACVTARSIEGLSKRDEMLGDLARRIGEECSGLPLAAWAAMAMQGKDARIVIHDFLNDRWDDCSR